MLRSAALRIIDSLGIEGGCNCQFALNPESFEYAVIEVNPRVSPFVARSPPRPRVTRSPRSRPRSPSAIRWTEIPNAVTGSKTCACFEPALDYVVVKLPKWPFDKFVYAKRTLGTQMKATGEVMAIGATFEEALMKAVRGAEIGHMSLNTPALAGLSPTMNSMEKLARMRRPPPVHRICGTASAGICRGRDPRRYEDRPNGSFSSSANLVQLEARSWPPRPLHRCDCTGKRSAWATRTRSSDSISGQEMPSPAPAGPTRWWIPARAEFARGNAVFLRRLRRRKTRLRSSSRRRRGQRKAVIVFGSGPIRIGQGIEFDYASVHCVWALQKARLRGRDRQQQPGNRFHGFRHRRPAVFRAAHAGGCDGRDRHGKALRRGRGLRRADGHQADRTSLPNMACVSSAHRRTASTWQRTVSASMRCWTELDIKRPLGHTVMTTEEALAAAERARLPGAAAPVLCAWRAKHDHRLPAGRCARIYGDHPRPRALKTRSSSTST